jgi:hypothetical protein
VKSFAEGDVTCDLVRPDQHRFAFDEALERREINSDIGDIATTADVMDIKACPDWWACLI